MKECLRNEQRGRRTREDQGGARTGQQANEGKSVAFPHLPSRKEKKNHPPPFPNFLKVNLKLFETETTNCSRLFVHLRINGVSSQPAAAQLNERHEPEREQDRPRGAATSPIASVARPSSCRCPVTWRQRCGQQRLAAECWWQSSAVAHPTGAHHRPSQGDRVPVEYG